jgi:chaperone modulatory protein CbpM
MAERDEVVWLHGETEITLVELSQSTGLPDEIVRELVDYGVLEPAGEGGVHVCFHAECVARVRTAARLRSDLELETPALALVLSFLERIQRLEAQVRHLHAQVAPPRR